jgi:protein-tyrosine phosphatase
MTESALEQVLTLQEVEDTNVSALYKHAPPPMSAWVARSPLWLVWYARSRLGDHGRLPPVRRLTQITGNVYLGGQIGLKGWRLLQNWGVGALVNLRVEWDDRRSGIDTPFYLWLPTIDGTPSTVEQLARGVAFMHEQIRAGRGVYVHCAAGFGRAPTQVVAYLISCGLSIDEAISFVKVRRPIISLSQRQRSRLQDYVNYAVNYARRTE